MPNKLLNKMLPLPIAILVSKWTYIVLAVILAIACGVLIWLGGYENPAVYIAGGSALESWSWRYETMQKAGLACGAISVILAFLVAVGTALFGGKDNEEEEGEYYDYYE